ncbi:MAG: hypothetical protein ACXVRS_17605 [Gaiellaceae bacterium]
MKRAAVAACGSMGVLLVAGCGNGGPVRQATASERAALTQATFDYLYTDRFLSKVSLNKVRIDLLPRPEPLGARLVTKYALVELRGYGTKGEDVGYNVAVAVYESTPWPGWHLFDHGSAEVGCDSKWYPAGQGRSIRKALGLTCAGP